MNQVNSRSKQAFLVFSAVILTLTLIGFASLFSYFRIKNQLESSLFSQRKSIAELSAKILQERFTKAKEIGFSLATRVKFREWVAIGNWEEAIKIMQEVPDNFSFVDRVFLSDTNGVLMADFPSLPGVIGTKRSDKEWYKGVMATRKTYLTGVHKRVGEPRINVIAVAVPIIQKKQMVGILVLQITVPTFLREIKDIDVGNTGFIFVVDPHGNLSSRADFLPLEEIVNFSDRPEVKKVLAGADGVEIFSKTNEENERLVAYYPVENYGWGVLVSQPANLALSEINKSLLGLKLIYLMVILLSTGFGVIIIFNVRKIRKYQEELISLNHKLIENIQTLEFLNRELDAFTASVSHDLRAPLRSILGFSKILSGSEIVKNDKEFMQLIRIILSSASNMDHLITDLLNLSRIARKEFQKIEVDMDNLVNLVMAELRIANPTFQGNLTIKKLPTVMGDPGLLKQVITNLISNAIKFSSGKEHPKIEIGSNEKPGEYNFYVKDNGVGFDMKYYDKLFEVFQRLHSQMEFEGSGVGLAIVNRIIVRHGGKTWAEGKVNEGATFYFSLPK